MAVSVIVDGTEIVGYVAEPKSQKEVGSSHGAPSSIPVVVDTNAVSLDVEVAVEDILALWVDEVLPEPPLPIEGRTCTDAPLWAIQDGAPVSARP